MKFNQSSFSITPKALYTVNVSLFISTHYCYERRDLELKSQRGPPIKCSIKSSLSTKTDLVGILDNFKLAITKKELWNVDIQVYFWLRLNSDQTEPRTTVSSMRNSAIVGWFGENDIGEFSSSNHERR